MSVGLHAGDVYFFLAGAEHRELILLGPAVTRVVKTEVAAKAGSEFLLRISAILCSTVRLF